MGLFNAKKDGLRLIQSPPSYSCTTKRGYLCGLPLDRCYPISKGFAIDGRLGEPRPKLQWLHTS